IPGQAEIDNILQETQLQVDLAAPIAVRDGLAWEEIAAVPVETAEAVVFSELDMTRETLVILSFLRTNSTSSANLRLNASDDSGATWNATELTISNSRRWDNLTLRGSLLFTPDYERERVIWKSMA